jgi:hypothetical protein
VGTRALLLRIAASLVLASCLVGTASAAGDGAAWAWGQNFYGQLGDNTGTDRHEPVQVHNLTGVVAIAGGWYHSLALKSDGTAWAWGDNDQGQLGDNTTTNRHEPVQIHNLTGVAAIAAGLGHSLAISGACLVDDSNNTGVEYGTPQRPFRTIQQGIDAAVSGGTVKVARGVYRESLLIRDERLEVKGGYPGGTYPGTGDFNDASRNPDPTRNQAVIDGGGAPALVECQGAAAAGSTLQGFRLRNGGAIFRGGVCLRRVLATSN